MITASGRAEHPTQKDKVNCMNPCFNSVCPCVKISAQSLQVNAGAVAVADVPSWALWIAPARP